ncbi:MAG: MOSC domain-containing protein [Bacteroidia bacterium]|nr:MOSC domain-containing protein [Methylotenera sp.]
MQDNPQTLPSISQTMPQIGKLEAIIVRPARHVAAIEVRRTIAIADVGLLHDRRGIASKNGTVKASNRQVTLIQAEHIDVIAKIMRLPALEASLLRRNLVISGINLLAIKPLFKHQVHYLQIGEVLLEITGSCAPCSRMEVLLWEGGYNAVRGHGGVNARVMIGGELNVGDAVNMQVQALQQSLDF